MDSGRAARKHLRKHIVFPIKMQIISAVNCPAGEVVGVGGIGQSFSIGGIGFDTLLPLVMGDLLIVQFTLPHETTVVRIEAQVKQVQELKRMMQGKYLNHVGVKFKDLSPDQIRYFTNYMTGTFLLI